MAKKNKIKFFLQSNLFLIIIISLFTLFFSLLKLSKGYTFEWDQADDASKVFSIISQKKPLLIGPRVSNDNGFFVGPYHYYFLLPFFLLTKGDPVAGSYAVIFINLLTTIVSFLLIKKIFNPKTAFIASLLLSICLGKTCWNVMYSPLIAISVFYVCYQIINNKFKFPLAMFIAGFISTIHLVPASLVPIIILSFFLAPQKPKLKEIFLGILFFIIPFIPLIIFDIRHDFLNLNKLLLMVFGRNNITISTIPPLWLRSFWRSLNIFSFFPKTFGRIFSLLILIISPFLFKNPKIKILVFVWIVLPLLVLSQYHGAISEYYYDLVIYLLPLFLSLILIKMIKKVWILYLILFIIFLFSICQINSIKPSLVSLQDKKAIVSYLINQKQDQPFNLSYETGVGLDFGFNYLFSYLNHLPQNVPNAHLYTLFTDNTLPQNSNIVFKQSIYSLVRK
ncbi:MAG: hypothetical protein PHX34_04190 [Candidatus Shapirobacteria bacterium]|nr:hypothetical protein [Candidatus Shapirobacteria bacterium]